MAAEPECISSAARDVAEDNNKRLIFVTERVKSAKELQRKNVHEFEGTLGAMLQCLETFNCVGGDSREILSELTILDVLLALDLTTVQISQCCSYLRLCLMYSKEISTATAACKTLSEVVKYSAAADFIHNQVDDALSWMNLTNASMQTRRVCGIMVLTEVALKVPVLILPKLEGCFDTLWNGLCATEKEVRHRALTLFNLCTKLLATRPQSIRSEIYDNLMNQLRTNLTSKASEKRVAGLLAFEPIVMHSTGISSSLRYEDLSIMLVPFIVGGGPSSGNSELRELLFRCLVVLCRFSRNLFVVNQLKDSMRFAMDSIKRSTHACAAFHMLIDLIPIIGPIEAHPFVEDICQLIVHVIEKSDTPCWEGLRCLAVICRVCRPPRMEFFVDSCIEHVFHWGLSSHLFDCMRDIMESSSSSYRIKLEESLLDMISVTLCGLPFRQQSGVERAMEFSELQLESKAYQISVALNALVQFGFSNSELMCDFIRDSVLPFIDNNNASVRNSAICTIVKLLLPPGEKGDLTVARRLCIHTVISRMLVVALSCSNAVVRETILNAFTEDFYPYLSEPQFLFKFCAALGDEEIKCRVAAVEQLCRMINYDPSHTLPALREEMVIMLNYISKALTPASVDSGLRLLTAVASNAPHFVVNFADGIFDALSQHFQLLHFRSPWLLPFLHCCTAVVTAVRGFSRCDRNFYAEIKCVCELLDALPTDRSFYACRLSCLRFLSATIGPQTNGEPPYKVFPALFWQLSTILRRGDENIDMRLEALRCVGAIGALDSHVFQKVCAMESEKPSTDRAIIFNRVTHRKCCRVVLGAIAILFDTNDKRGAPVREGLVRTGLQTIVNIAERCPCAQGELKVVVAPLANVLREMQGGQLFATALYTFTNLIEYTGEDVLECAGDLYKLFQSVWENQSYLSYRFLVVRMLTIIAKFEVTGNVQRGKEHAEIVPHLLDSVSRKESNPVLKYAVLQYILVNTESLQPYCETVIFSLLAAVSSSPADYVNSAITVLKLVCSTLFVHEYVGAIVRVLLGSLTAELSAKTTSFSTPLYKNIMGVFCALFAELQGDFLKYAVDITQALKSFRVTHEEFTSMKNQLSRGSKCSRSTSAVSAQNAEIAALRKKCDSNMSRSLNRLGELWTINVLANDNQTVDEDRWLPINEQQLLLSLKTIPQTKEEWSKFNDSFSLRILQESPYLVFRCVSSPIGFNAVTLVERSPEFTQDVINVAFRSLWTFASANLRTSIVDFFRQIFHEALTTNTVPDDVLPLLLNIVEYMDHAGETLSISNYDVSECAWNRGMLAKALYWREAAYRQDPDETVESLITLYSELHMVDSSVGILNLASEDQRKGLMQSSLVKLARYTQALELAQQEMDVDGVHSESSSTESTSKNFITKTNYRGWTRSLSYGKSSDGGASLSRLDDNPVDRRLEVNARLMLCLSELGDYNRVLVEWNRILRRSNLSDTEAEDGDILHYVSQYAADASIRLQSWDTLGTILTWLPNDTVLYHISAAALHIVHEHYDIAQTCVVEGRKMLLEHLSGLLHESYARAYEGFVVAQELSEMEEVITAKRLQKGLKTSDHLPFLSRLWESRIRLMSPTVPAWKQVLGVRGLLIPPSQDTKTRIRFVKLCRQENAKQLEKFALDELLGVTNPTAEQLFHKSANPRVVMQYISYLSASKELGAGTKFGLESDLIKKMIDVHSNAENSGILSRAYARLGTTLDLNESINCYKAALRYDSKWNLAWRLWAEANSELLNQGYTDSACTNAVEGYIHSIQLGTSESTMMQDLLKLLTLWSTHCDSEHGLRELRSRVLDVSTSVWRLVVPQLIARLDSGTEESCGLVADIVTIVAYDYPHLLIYPLNLCSMSDAERRRRWAGEIMAKMKVRYPIIVSQGCLMISELIRTSALLHERWYDKLESAATAFFGRSSKEQMELTLLPMVDTLNKVPETIAESEFLSKFSKTLKDATEWLRSYSLHHNMADIQSAWNLYHGVYRQIDAQIKSSKELFMQFCSPKLFEARDLVVGIPDARTRRDETFPRISSFHDLILVIASKQRPKRIGVTLSNGQSQKYLLKGREDLRLDERVMQLFGLVNILMLSDPRTSKNFGFQIQVYSVTPLRDTVGIIGWVDACNTLHELVKYYRERKGIHPELELRMLNQIITYDNPKAYDYLKVMSKIEVMEFLTDHTSGDDIRKAMWASAPNCETWLEQRRMYTTSLANMSVVGYILGLGDRHPNNIMMEKSSGHIVHIDFGDCFEVAMTRDKFPEKIPFRLTRMLRNALDVSGVSGAFRSHAESSMFVLREGSHSVLALLEAFIQDPLISWRLVNRPGQEPESSNDHKTIEEQVTLANMRKKSELQANSMSASIDGEKRSVSFSASKYAAREDDVDVVHLGMFIFKRLHSKLKGEDFVGSGENADPLDPRTQVGRLIAEATDVVNVAQSWSGWFPFW